VLKALIIITGGIRREGITCTQLNYMAKMDKTDMQIDYAAVHNNDHNIYSEFNEMNCKVIEFPDRKKHVLQYIKKIYKHIKKERYDIVHVHGSSAILSIELLIAKLTKVKVRIVHSHNTKNSHILIDKLLRLIFHNLYTDAFACGQEAGKWLFGKKSFTVINNGIDLKKYTYNEEMRSQYRKKYHWEEKIVIGHVGTFNPSKNHKFLIEIFCKLASLNNKYVFCLIGDGIEKHHIEMIVQQYGLNDRVVFTGSIDYVHYLLQSMDLMLLPSLFEGLPNVVLEWQAAGLPCIISESVSKECSLTPLTHFLPIENIDSWVKMIESFDYPDRTRNAKTYIDMLRAAGYDLCENATELKKLYYSLLYNPSN